MNATKETLASFLIKELKIELSNIQAPEWCHDSDFTITHASELDTGNIFKAISLYFQRKGILIESDNRHQVAKFEHAGKLFVIAVSNFVQFHILKVTVQEV